MGLMISENKHRVRCSRKEGIGIGMSISMRKGQVATVPIQSLLGSELNSKMREMVMIGRGSLS
jgi:hypothetical protein